MTPEAAFWQAIRAGDPVARLVYADWLEERGELSDVLLAAFLRSGKGPPARPLRRRRLLRLPRNIFLRARDWARLSLPLPPLSCDCGCPWFFNQRIVLSHNPGCRTGVDLGVCCRRCCQRRHLLFAP